jgi:hypothetical protein
MRARKESAYGLEAGDQKCKERENAEYRETPSGRVNENGAEFSGEALRKKPLPDGVRDQQQAEGKSQPIEISEIAGTENG